MGEEYSNEGAAINRAAQDCSDENVSSLVGGMSFSWRKPKAAEDEARRRQESEMSEGSVYRQLEPLSAARHSELGIVRGANRFAFARSMRVAPISLDEFQAVARHYPIIFVGPERQACAVLGLRDGENLFVGADGAYAKSAYIPATLRQYPFLLVRDGARERMVLCIDSAADNVARGDGVALFEDGAPTEFSKQVLNDLNRLQKGLAQAEDFSRRVEELGLFGVKEVKVVAGPAGEAETQARPLATYTAIDMARLAALPPGQIKALVQDQTFDAIYAHQISLQNWRRILGRAFAADRAAA